MLHEVSHPLTHHPAIPRRLLASTEPRVHHEYGGVIVLMPHAPPERLVIRETPDVGTSPPRQHPRRSRVRRRVVLAFEFHLDVAQRRERNPHAEHRARVLILEIEPLAHFPAVHGEEERAGRDAAASRNVSSVGASVSAPRSSATTRLCASRRSRVPSAATRPSRARRGNILAETRGRLPGRSGRTGEQISEVSRDAVVSASWL